MDLRDRKVIARMEYKAPNEYKTSDFSIDHILNKAGSSVSQRDEYRCHSGENHVPHYHYDNRNELMSDDYMHCGPILNWLQYSRYHPPRLPSECLQNNAIARTIRMVNLLFVLFAGPAKVGPVKRTPGRLPRVPFTPHQLNELENAYKKSTYLSSEDANHLAIKLDLTSTRVSNS